MVAGGPRQRLLRPIELEDPKLADDLHQAALFGPTPIFDRAQGVQHGFQGAALTLRQERDVQIRLEEDGSVLVQLSAEQPRESGRGFGSAGMLLVEETVQQRLASAPAFSAWTLKRIDSTQKLTHLAAACRLLGAEHRSWVSQAEASRIAASGSMNMAMGGADPEPVRVNVRRATLNLDAGRIVEDLLVPIRRHWRRQA